MRSKTPAYILLALVAIFAMSRGIWFEQSYKTTKAVNTIIAGNSEAKSVDEAISLFNAQMLKAERLTKTCLLVAACTPNGAVAAQKIVNAELDRDVVTLQRNKIKADALAIVAAAKVQYQTTGKIDVEALKAQIAPLQTKYDALGLEMVTDTHTIYELYPSAPKSLQPIFEHTF